MNTEARDIIVSEECLNFIDNSSRRVKEKFKYLVEIIIDHPIVHQNFVEKLVNSRYYELKIKADNQIRIIIYTIDSQNFNTSKEVILLNGFIKKSNKDYKKAIRKADRLIEKYGYENK